MNEKIYDWLKQLKKGFSAILQHYTVLYIQEVLTQFK